MKKYFYPTGYPLFYNLLFAILFAFCILLPDLVLMAFIPSYRVSFEPLFALAMTGAGLLFSFNKSRFFFFLIIGILALMQIAQISSIAYFGYPLSPSEVYKIFYEFSDISSVGLTEAKSLWIVPFSIILSFGILIAGWLWVRQKTFTFPFAFLFVLLLFAPKIERAMRKEIKHFLPSSTRYSFHNTLNTFSFYFGKEMWLSDNFRIPEQFYLPYSSEKNEAHAETIFLVIGESVNPEHLSLFGYNRQTTPFLESMKENPFFDSQHAISGGVSTHTSLAFLLNGIREPGNLKELKNKTFNLFHMAKMQGFTTYFVSAQDSKTTYEIGAEYIDKIVTRENYPILFDQKKDMALLDILKTLPMTEKNLVVVQLRCPHSPYEEHYDDGSAFDRFDAENERVDEYDNALLFFDHVIQSLFGLFKTIAKGDSYFIFTSDHGQAFGEKGFFGHNKLDLSIAVIPYFSYSSDGRKIPYKQPSHYEMLAWIAELLGYRLINPNLETGIFYIHGNNFLSNYEFITYLEKDGEIELMPNQFLKSYIEQRLRGVNR